MPDIKNYPDVILLTPHSEPILKKLFCYHARVYDLNAYEAVAPGSAQRIWDSYMRQEAHEAEMAELRARLAHKEAALTVTAGNLFERLKARWPLPSGP